MQTSTILHYAFRARDPEKLGHFYADLFEGRFVLHPVMTALGIIMVKLNHPEALFNGLLEIWPWDLIWDGRAAVFRKVPPQPSPTSYGHIAVKVIHGTAQIIDELRQRGLPHRMEPRGPGFLIPVIDDPEGNMIELFPNMDHAPVPPEALCSPDVASQAIAALRRQFAERTSGLPPEKGYPLLMP
jgi:catechol 2,3-dioxygenase-like lactoylglutathione lyase family enzyme